MRITDHMTRGMSRREPREPGKPRAANTYRAARRNTARVARRNTTHRVARRNA